jgi:uncharacterized protein YndB with AHSA1/START domain
MKQRGSLTAMSSNEVSKPMTSVERVIAATPEQVWAVLSDGWLYPVWVVGATHMRNVDDGWPAPGARLHHQVGAWPMMLSDTTEVVRADPKRQLVLQGRAWPAGEVRIELTIESHAQGSLVRMAEGPTHGPAHFLDNPVQRKILAARNRESLGRLASIAETR